MADDDRQVLEVSFAKPDLARVVQTREGPKPLLTVHNELRQAYVFGAYGAQLRDILRLPAFCDGAGEPVISLRLARQWIRDGGWDEERRAELAESEAEFRLRARAWKIEAQMERLRDMRTLFKNALTHLEVAQPEIKSAEGAWNALANLAKTVAELESQTLDPLVGTAESEEARPITAALSSDDLAAISRLFVERKAVNQAQRALTSESMPAPEPTED